VVAPSRKAKCTGQGFYHLKIDSQPTLDGSHGHADGVRLLSGVSGLSHVLWGGQPSRAESSGPSPPSSSKTLSARPPIVPSANGSTTSPQRAAATQPNSQKAHQSQQPHVPRQPTKRPMPADGGQFFRMRMRHPIALRLNRSVKPSSLEAPPTVSARKMPDATWCYSSNRPVTRDGRTVPPSSMVSRRCRKCL